MEFKADALPCESGTNYRVSIGRETIKHDLCQLQTNLTVSKVAEAKSEGFTGY